MPKFTILEPMSTGDVIDRAVRLYRRNFIPVISIVAIPALLGYLSSLMFWYGYTTMLTGVVNPNARLSGDAVALLIIGGIGYPFSMYVLLLAVSGLSRSVGDHLMLGEPISFRRCVGVVRKRFGAITLLAVLCVVMLIVAYFVVSFVFAILILLIGVLAGATEAAKLPQWLTVTLISIVGLAAAAAMIFVVCVIIARLIFMPQVVMIEGEGAGGAIARAIRLGKGNWYKVGSIAFFAYFIWTSLFAALLFPILAGLYLSGEVGAEFYLSPTWSVLYTSCRDIASLLSLPVWIVAFTLLYFDSRVRKEAYDLELLAREVGPEFNWQPPVPTPLPAFSMPGAPDYQGSYVQTVGLGLAGWRPPVQPTPAPDELPPASSPEEEYRRKFEEAAASFAERDKQNVQPSTPVPDRTYCVNCGASLSGTELFCMQC